MPSLHLQQPVVPRACVKDSVEVLAVRVGDEYLSEVLTSHEPYYLLYKDKRLKLSFDCRHCQMLVLEDV